MLVTAAGPLGGPLAGARARPTSGAAAKLETKQVKKKIQEKWKVRKCAIARRGSVVVLWRCCGWCLESIGMSPTRALALLAIVLRCFQLLCVLLLLGNKWNEWIGIQFGPGRVAFTRCLIRKLHERW